MSGDREVDVAREALARWLSAAIDRESTWDRSGEDYRDRYRIDADKILAGPLHALVAAAEAVQRVEAVVAFIDECVAFSPTRRKPIYEDIARRLRAAVAGTP